MIEEGRTDFDLSITIPNTKRRTNMKYSANYVRLSEYMNLDERLENAIKNQTKSLKIITKSLFKLEVQSDKL